MANHRKETQTEMLEEEQQMPLEKQRNRNAKGGEGADDFRETEMQE